MPAVRADGPGLNRIFRPYPRVLPHALGAGIEPDSEAIECFRTMNLSFHDREVHTEDEWRLFLEKVRRRVSRRVGAVRGWADGSVTPSHRRQPRGGASNAVKLSASVRPSGWRQIVVASRCRPRRLAPSPLPALLGSWAPCGASGVIGSGHTRMRGAFFLTPNKCAHGRKIHGPRHLPERRLTGPEGWACVAS